jgi:hypothetical protein
MGGMKMQPDAVHRTAGSAADIASRMPAKTKTGFDLTEEAAYQHRAFASGPALDSCRNAWISRLQAVSDRVSATAERLHQAASSYTSQDARVAADLDRAVTDLGRR